jgi:hypothetical protein
MEAPPQAFPKCSGRFPAYSSPCMPGEIPRTDSSVHRLTINLSRKDSANWQIFLPVLQFHYTLLKPPENTAEEKNRIFCRR